MVLQIDDVRVIVSRLQHCPPCWLIMLSRDAIIEEDTSTKKCGIDYLISNADRILGLDKKIGYHAVHSCRRRTWTKSII